MARSTQLVFLLSLPRSGSTLLQRLLTAHAQVASSAEPWLMLPLLWATRRDGVFSQYRHWHCSTAIGQFLSQLPGGEAAYHQQVRELAYGLYGRMCQPGQTHFLDKTPPYCLIADTLVEAMPEARFIFLWRHPLATVASLVETFCGRRWRLDRYMADLHVGVERLLRAQDLAGPRGMVVQYESLVTDGEATLRPIFAHLGLPFDPTVLTRFNEVQFTGSFQDPVGTKQAGPVHGGSLDKWKQTLTTPVRQQWCQDYLSWIGRERLAAMGYDLAQLRGELASIPRRRRGNFRDRLDLCRTWFNQLVQPQVLGPQWRCKDRRRRYLVM
jgi:hypothetical protein